MDASTFIAGSGRIFIRLVHPTHGSRVLSVQEAEAHLAARQDAVFTDAYSTLHMAVSDAYRTSGRSKVAFV